MAIGHCTPAIPKFLLSDMQAQNVQNCKENLKQNQRDLELVKDSITTLEVCFLLHLHLQCIQSAY